jgi:hypothetical protein
MILASRVYMCVCARARACMRAQLSVPHKHCDTHRPGLLSLRLVVIGLSMFMI